MVNYSGEIELPYCRGLGIYCDSGDDSLGLVRTNYLADRISGRFSAGRCSSDVHDTGTIPTLEARRLDL